MGFMTNSCSCFCILSVSDALVCGRPQSPLQLLKYKLKGNGVDIVFSEQLEMRRLSDAEEASKEEETNE